VRVKTFSPYLDALGWPQWRVDADDWFIIELSALSRLTGDADGNGIVDAADAATLAANWLGTNKTWSEGDFNGDGKVNDLDAALLAANWLKTGAATAAVPEPAALPLLVCTIASLLSWKYLYD